MDEITLIERSKQGDKWALNELLKSCYPLLTGYVIKLTMHPQVAEDIVQETFLKAVVNIKKFDPRGKFSTYLVTIATNTYRDYLRKNRHTEPLMDDLLDLKSNPEETVLREVEYKKVLNILSSLPYEKRAVFILKHYYGYKYEEISDILNCPIGTVRSRLHNSIKLILSNFENEEVIS